MSTLEKTTKSQLGVFNELAFTGPNPKITLPPPTGDNDPATKKYVDDNVGITAVLDDLAPELANDLDAAGYKIINLGYPTSTTDAASLIYVTTALQPKIEAVSDDTAPQLSNDLDVNTFSITTTETDGNITITPNGAGLIRLGDDNLDGIVTIKSGTNDSIDTTLKLDASGIGQIDTSGKRIENLSTPLNPFDASNKFYADLKNPAWAFGIIQASESTFSPGEFNTPGVLPVVIGGNAGGPTGREITAGTSIAGTETFSVPAALNCILEFNVCIHHLAKAAGTYNIFVNLRNGIADYAGDATTGVNQYSARMIKTTSAQEFSTINFVTCINTTGLLSFDFNFAMFGLDANSVVIGGIISVKQISPLLS